MARENFLVSLMSHRAGGLANHVEIKYLVRAGSRRRKISQLVKKLSFFFLLCVAITFASEWLAEILLNRLEK